MQLQLGVPSNAETAEDGFDQLFVMYGHGNSDKFQVDCNYLMLEDGEYVHTMEL